MDFFGKVVTRTHLSRPLTASTRNLPRVPARSPVSRVLQQRYIITHNHLSPRSRLWPRRINHSRVQCRHKSFVQSSRELLREHPIAFPTVIIGILIAMSSYAYVNYIYRTYFIGAYHNYPEPVAVKLRRAIYYTNYQLDAKNALKYYKQALQLAEELRMDPFSDEILGVKISIAHLMEKIGNHGKAVEILEIIRADCLKWIETYGDEALQTEEKSVGPGMGEEEREELMKANENVRWKRGKRTRVLKKVVQFSAKLGEMYADPHVWDRDAAEERLVWAVEAGLKEKERRQKEGVKEGEGDWLSDNELGASLESLAHEFEAKDMHFLATPLFLQALSLQGKTDCHTVVLMNNVAMSLSQQNPRSNHSRLASTSMPNPGPSPDLKSAKETLLSNAMAWADRALSVADNVIPPERNEECDTGCAVATHNLGEILEMRGQRQEARKRYEEAESLSKAIGFDDGVKQAAAGLKRLKNAGA